MQTHNKVHGNQENVEVGHYAEDSNHSRDIEQGRCLGRAFGHRPLLRVAWRRHIDDDGGNGKGDVGESYNHNAHPYHDVRAIARVEYPEVED